MSQNKDSMSDDTTPFYETPRHSRCVLSRSRLTDHSLINIFITSASSSSSSIFFWRGGLLCINCE